MIEPSTEIVNVVRFDGSPMQCPICRDFDCVHLAQVVVNQNGMVTAIKREGDFLAEGPKGQRGSHAMIYFWCESGHQFCHTYEFHKGQVFCHLERLPDVVFGTSVMDAWPGELWRD